MTHLQNNFIVFGPAGRCGSHWVETLLKNLFGVWHTIGPFTPLQNGWIYHTNSTTDLMEMPSEIRNSARLIYCVRRKYFDVAISFLMAENTDEWHTYTSKTVEPFVADTVNFQTLINNLHYMQTVEIPEDIFPLFNNPITIDFDSLGGAAIPEKYIADQLSMDYDTNKNYCQPDSAISNINTRNYKDFILNYDELIDIYKTFSIGCTQTKF